MRIHHSAPYDPASFVHHTHRRPLETNVQSCKHPHRCSPSFARGITSGKGRLPAGEQQPHVWVLDLKWSTTMNSPEREKRLSRRPATKSCAIYLNPRCSPEGYLAHDLF